MTTTHAVLNVPAVSCNHCKMAIEGALARAPGVDHVEVDVPGKSLTVDYRADDGVAGATSRRRCRKRATRWPATTCSRSSRRPVARRCAPFGKVRGSCYHIASLRPGR